MWPCNSENNKDLIQFIILSIGNTLYRKLRYWCLRAKKGIFIKQETIILSDIKSTKVWTWPQGIQLYIDKNTTRPGDSFFHMSHAMVVKLNIIMVLFMLWLYVKKIVC
jgi:hypothetical protein